MRKNILHLVEIYVIVNLNQCNGFFFHYCNLVPRAFSLFSIWSSSYRKETKCPGYEVVIVDIGIASKGFRICVVSKIVVLKLDWLKNNRMNNHEQPVNLIGRNFVNKTEIRCFKRNERLERLDQK